MLHSARVTMDRPENKDGIIVNELQSSHDPTINVDNQADNTTLNHIKSEAGDGQSSNESANFEHMESNIITTDTAEIPAAKDQTENMIDKQEEYDGVNSALKHSDAENSNSIADNQIKHEILDGEDDGREDTALRKDSVLQHSPNINHGTATTVNTIPPKVHKKRRRIVSLSHECDDSSDDNETPTNIDSLPRSPSPHASTANALPADTADGSAEFAHITHETIEALAKHDRPGPKSKKASTLMLKELQVRALLQSAIVIPAAADLKRRKIRILDSDDETNDVDDIGAIAEDSAGNINAPGVEDVLLMPDGDAHLNVVAEEETLLGDESMCMALALNLDDRDDSQDGMAPPEDDPMFEGSERSFGDSNSEHNHNRDSGNSSDGLEEQPTTSTVVGRQTDKNILPVERNFETSDEEYLPNELYFGTPDSSVIASSHRGRGGRGGGRGGRGRGRPPLHSSMSSRDQEPKQMSKPRGRPRGSGRRGRPPLRNRFVDDRSVDTSTSTGDSDSASETDQLVAAKKQPHKTHIAPAIANRIETKPPKPKIKSRYPDKSRLIPDSIYFGDVDVPLHVLHSYGNTSDESEVETAKLSRTYALPPSPRTRGRPPGSGASSAVARTPSTRGRKPGYTVSPSPTSSSTAFLAFMKKCYKVAGLKRTRFSSLWGDECRSTRARADRILELLHENGLVGEPTIAACRQLKKEIVTKEEISELDPNLIIQSEGRTRRQSARAATHRNYTFDDPDAPAPSATIKFTPILDSDSDSD